MKKITPINIKEKQIYFEKLGESFEAFMSDYDVEQRKSLVFSHLLKHKIIRNSKILEVGCGTGRFSVEIVKRGGCLTAFDIGPHLVRKVSGALSCSGAAGDACCLPFVDNSFDFIISSECIEHTLDPEKALEEMCRVCRTGGGVCLTTPNRLWYPLLLVSQWLKVRKFSGIENWIFPYQAIRILQKNNMGNIHVAGCHLLPFQLKIIRPFLSYMDRFGKWLFPMMINFGLIAIKK